MTDIHNARCLAGAYVWASDDSIGYRIAGAIILIATIAMCVLIARGRKLHEREGSEQKSPETRA